MRRRFRLIVNGMESELRRHVPEPIWSILPPRTRRALALLCLGCAALTNVAAQALGAGIYTCTDDRGRKLTSDRPIADCSHKEQLLLNRDGSVRSVIPPTLTAEERAERDARERRAAEARSAQADAARRDRNLMSRYRNQDSHDRARAAALEHVQLAIRNTELRMKELSTERQPLLSEAEFDKGRTLPAKLKQQLDANDAAIEAQRNSASNQSAERARVNKLYDIELDRLRRLWAGTAAGTLGPMEPAPDSAAGSGSAASAGR